jgi:imidazolonepropionase-like amidohydrolase
MAAAVQAAHAAGARAAVHTFSEEGVEIMVRAGVDSVEHGTGLSLDLIDEMARRAPPWCPR